VTNRSLPQRRLAVPFLIVVLAACSARRPAKDDRSGVARQDTLPAFTTAPVRHPASTQTPVWLRGVWTAPDSGFDRLVLEFSGDTIPGYSVQYANGPVRRCGSGDSVTLAGTERLVLHLVPAQAHDDSGRVTIGDREWMPNLPALRQVKLICDFEGVVEWAIGLSGRRSYRLLETASAPRARLILEVRHR
jgi:hypothetical protein